MNSIETSNVIPKTECSGPEIVCPWCRYVNADSWEYGEDDDEHECPNCGKKSHLRVFVDITYTSRPCIEGDSIE